MSSKQDEGSSYKDNTTGTYANDDAIAPGRIYNYIWEVSERAGPGPKDTACVTWAYYSDVNPVKDTNTGLVGPLVICRKVSSLLARLPAAVRERSPRSSPPIHCWTRGLGIVNFDQ